MLHEILQIPSSKTNEFLSVYRLIQFNRFFLINLIDIIFHYLIIHDALHMIRKKGEKKEKREL